MSSIPDDSVRCEGTSAFDRAYFLALDDHNRGIPKGVDEYLRLVSTDLRGELASLIAATLTPRTPTGASAAEFAEGYARALAAVETVESSAGPTGILPGALESMSRARGVEPEQVVATLANEFGIDSEEGKRALRRYYHRLRSGQLIGSRITHRLLTMLARFFDAEPEDFIAAVRPAGPGSRLIAAPAMPRRAGASRRDASPRAQAVDPAPHPDEELVMRLFCGGPDA
jgi:hypothetical protein